MGMIRRLVGSVMAAAGGVVGTMGYYKYDAITSRAGRMGEALGLPRDDSTALAYVMLAGGAAMVMLGVLTCVRKEK